MIDQNNTKISNSGKHHVFKRVENLFQSRKLERAAHILSSKIEEGKFLPHDLPQAKLLLAKVLLKKSEYIGDKQLLLRCESLVTEVLGIARDAENKIISFEASLLIAQVYIHQDDFEKVNRFLREAGNFCLELDNDILSLRHRSVVIDFKIGNNNFNEAYDLAMRALSDLENISNEERAEIEADIYLSLVRIFIKKQDYKKSQEYNEAILNYAINFQDVEKELMALNNMAIIYSLQFDYRKAMEYLLDALERSEEIFFHAQIARCQINLGSIYAQLFNYDEAIKKYTQVLERFDELLEKSSKVILFNNLGNIYYQKTDINQAITYYNKAYLLAKETQYEEMLPHTLAQLSKCCIAQEDYKLADKFNTEASITFDEKPNLSGWPIHLINEGIVEEYKGNHSVAIIRIKKSLLNSQARQDRNTEIEALATLSQLCRKHGKLEEAFEYLNQYVESSRNYELDKQGLQILDLEISYALKEKQKTIEQLIKDNEYKALLLKQGEKITEQNEELVEINEELKQYAYITSHDLKEPLRMIKSFSQLISKNYSDKLDNEGQEYLSYVEEGASRMDMLLDDLLKYTRIGSSEIEIESIDLNQIVDIVKLHLTERINQTKAIVISENLPIISSNKQLLIQLVQNFISNAIKFHKPNTIPEVKISITENDYSYILNVSDNGIGISEENLDRIFVLFQRLHAKNKFEGTGIGLAICKKIAKKLGGDISIKSQVGLGSTFSISLPKNYHF